MHRQKLNDALFDALLGASALAALDEELNALPSIEMLNESYPSTEQLAARVKSLIKRDKLKRRLYACIKATGKAAACLAILFTLLSVSLLSVEASRSYLLNAVLSWQKGATEIRFEDASQNPAGDVYLPAYLPSGFKQTSVHKGGISTLIVYEKDDGTKIHFNQRPADAGATFVDNEHTNYSEVSIGGIPGYLFESVTEGTANTLVWEIDRTAFILSSTIDSEELIKIGENLKE